MRPRRQVELRRKCEEDLAWRLEWITEEDAKAYIRRGLTSVRGRGRGYLRGLRGGGVIGAAPARARRTNARCQRPCCLLHTPPSARPLAQWLNPRYCWWRHRFWAGHAALNINDVSVMLTRWRRLQKEQAALVAEVCRAASRKQKTLDEVTEARAAKRRRAEDRLAAAGWGFLTVLG